MANMEMPFDGKRMFWGGFEQIVGAASCVRSLRSFRICVSSHDGCSICSRTRSRISSSHSWVVSSM